MKVTCPRDSLLTACQLVSAAVAARTTKPILSNVKATADADRLLLMAYDTEVGIRYELRGIQVARAGSAILPITHLTQILRESQEPEISLDAKDEGTEARTGTSRFQMPAYPVEEFPEVPAFDDGGRYHEVTAGVLRAMIRRTAFAADKKESTRFALSGVLWEAEGKSARLVATDSKRLAVCEGPAALFGPAETTKGSHLVPFKTMTLLERNLTDDGELVRVALKPNEAMFQTERSMIYSRLVEGRYPPYKDIIPKRSAVKVPLPTTAFLNKVRPGGDHDGRREQAGGHAVRGRQADDAGARRGVGVERGGDALGRVRRGGGEDRLRPAVPGRVPAGHRRRADGGAGDDRRQQARAVPGGGELPVPGDAAGGVMHVAKDDNRGPERIADILGKLFASRGWGRKSERQRLEQAWAAAVGPATLPDTRVGGLRRGVLEVDVRNAVLMQELTQYHKRKLLEALRLALAGVRLTDIKFRAGVW